MREWKLSEVRYGIVRERQYEVAVFPIGATEPHGLHLPYGTDAIQVEALADRACEAATAEGARVILLPTIPYGVDTNQLEFPLAMSVDPSVLNAILTCIVRCLEHHGIRKLIVLNGHGGNNFGNHLRELYGQTGVFIACVDTWKIAERELRETFERPGEHADEMETSQMLHLRPDLVSMDGCGDGSVKSPRCEAMREGWAWFVRPWEKLTIDSGYGDPRAASADKGQAFLDLCAAKLARFIVELSEARMDAAFPY